MSMCREKVEAFWAQHDKNNDGVLSADEVKGGLKSSGQCKMSESAIDTLFSELGLKAGDNITKQAFMEAFKKKRKEVLKQVFARMDKDKSGKLSGSELMAVLMTEDLYSQDDINALLHKCQDKDGDKMISCEEFIEAAF